MRSLPRPSRRRAREAFEPGEIRLLILAAVGLLVCLAVALVPI